MSFPLPSMNLFIRTSQPGCFLEAEDAIIEHMKILLESNELYNYLEKNNGSIGTRLSGGLANAFAGLACAVPNAFVDFKDLFDIPGSGRIVKIALVILGLAFAAYGVFGIYTAWTNKFDFAKMYDDIRNMNKIEHPFSIIAIKDSFNEHPNRFLLHYDPRWDCRLFFSFSTAEGEGENIERIKERLSNALKIDSGGMSVALVAEEIYTKFSESDKVNKLYHHKFYSVKLGAFSDTLKQDSFTIDGVDYSWMTINDMVQDPDILKKNMDVIGIVNRCIP